MGSDEKVDISPKNDGGVLKTITKPGTGNEKPANGSKVHVHYTGKLTDGTEFDSSRPRGEPFEFTLGKGNVIKAWDIGVATMLKGEVCELTCASEYAYGKTGSPPTIPPDATLIFEIEMISWSGEDISPKKDGGIERYQILPGDGYSTPNDGALVEAHIIGSYEGDVFEDRDVSFNIGEGADLGVIEGVEKALEKFKKGEQSRCVIKPKYAFGTTGKPESNIPPNATVEYNITLKSFEKAKESWSLDAEERIEQSKLFKDKGTSYFKQNKFQLATKMYNKITSLLAAEKDNEGDNANEIRLLKLSAQLNISLCYLKQNMDFEAKTAATEALKIDENSEKAYFRRGQALLSLGEPLQALNDFNEVLRLEPNNKAAQAQVIQCQKQIREDLTKEKKIYANMFDKFAKFDAQKEEEERKQLPDVMNSLGEWGEEERERAPTDFEKENPNILLLNSDGQFKDM